MSSQSEASFVRTNQKPDEIITSGWGKMGESETWSRMLRMASVPIASTRECEKNVAIKYKIKLKLIDCLSSCSILG